MSRIKIRLHALNFDLTKGFLSEGELTPVDGTPAGIALRSRQPFYYAKADLQGFRSDVAERLLAEGPPGEDVGLLPFGPELAMEQELPLPAGTCSGKGNR